ncbi:UDP-glucose/GDP-mannose dehydrogenase family protein [Fulvivirgaceae bacterium BMA10]|uniref:UDP-glucose 6-dehydrogenase n=1 Tax=Splendidivirga corallicola TaxID=3051826 RepID=A0ABT8KM38_9BACT|nr:UDP-glucose/GDP-mannose dehydrogenase family protein [Fulvivirgaceae bacterium BMA10]
MANVTIFGAGYVGVPTGAHFARTHTVTVYDPDARKVQSINDVIEKKSDSLHIHEKGLIELLQENHENIHATSDILEALEDPEIIFIAVGTPPNEKGRANLKYVCAAAEQIAKNIKNDCVVLNKSTVPPGTAYLVKEIIENNRVNDVKISVGSCPEFLAEGTAIEDLRTPDRIVYGCDDQDALDRVTDFFLYLHGKATLCPMSTVSSEVTKYAANALLATKISFMNSLAMLCDSIGANVREVQDGVGKDTRIGRKFLNASMGYGGSCFPKDTMAIAEYGQLFKSPLEIIESTIKVNDKTTNYFTEKIIETFGSDLSGKNFIVWGIGFKARTDDLRESKPVQVAKELMDRGAHVHIYDTVAGALTNFVNENNCYEGKFTLHHEQYEMVSEAIDGLVIGNEHEKFRNLNIKILKIMRGKHIYDGKNILNNRLIKDLIASGFTYKSIGKDSVASEIEKNKLISFLKNEYMD